jgi:hypothetical protein
LVVPLGIGYVPRAKEPKKVRFSPKKAFDLILILGFNVGSLLRIPRARLLSGTERLGSLKERKGYRESGAAVERSEKKRMHSIERIPGQNNSLWGLENALCED